MGFMGFRGLRRFRGFRGSGVPWWDGRIKGLGV